MAAAPNRNRYYAGNPITNLEHSPTSGVCADRNAITNEVLLIEEFSGCGMVIDGCVFKAQGDTAAGSIFIWYFDAVLNDYRLIDEVDFPAITVSDTVASARVVWEPPIKPFVLNVNDKLYFTVTDGTSGWNGYVVGGDLSINSGDPSTTP